MRNSKPAIRKGDVFVITGYSSLLHHDRFSHDVDQKDMTSARGLVITKKNWVIIPRDLHLVRVAKNIRNDSFLDSVYNLPKGYQKKVYERGYLWELRLKEVRPSKRS